MKLHALLVRDPESIERFLRHQKLWTEPLGLAEVRPPPYFRSIIPPFPAHQTPLLSVTHAWTVAARLQPMTTCQVLLNAGKHLVSAGRPLLYADSGMENVNAVVDAPPLLSACLERVLAQVDVTFSNSMIEAFWRLLKHQWLFLNSLASIEHVRALVAFYVEQHNTKSPMLPSRARPRTRCISARPVSNPTFANRRFRHDSHSDAVAYTEVRNVPLNRDRSLLHGSRSRRDSCHRRSEHDCCRPNGWPYDRLAAWTRIRWG
jgi:hypothetical protein